VSLLIVTEVRLFSVLQRIAVSFISLGALVLYLFGDQSWGWEYFFKELHF